MMNVCEVGFNELNDRKVLLSYSFCRLVLEFNWNRMNEISNETKSSGHGRYGLLPYLILLFCAALVVLIEAVLLCLKL